MNSIKWKVNTNFSYSLIKENILKLYVDAIINPANSQLKHGGGLAKLIKDSAGADKFQLESDEYIKKYGDIKPGHCGVTSVADFNRLSGNRYIKYVIHAVGPIWNGGTENEAEILKLCFNNVFKEAAKLKLYSIAVPPISTGIYKFPKELAADIFYDCISEFAEKNENKK